MGGLEVPHLLAGLDVERDQRAREEVVAVAMAAVVVAGRRLDRHVDVAELLVGRHLRPRAGVAGVGPRLVEPRLVARLAVPGNRREPPQLLAAAHVVAGDDALDVLLGRRRATGQVRGADDDDAVDDDGGRVQADLSLLDVLERVAELRPHVDDALGAERRVERAGGGVDRQQLIAGRDEEDTPGRTALPVGHAAAREAARERARALVEAPRPQQLAGGGIDADRRAPRSHRGIERAVGVERVWSAAAAPGAARRGRSGTATPPAACRSSRR